MRQMILMFLCFASVGCPHSEPRLPRLGVTTEPFDASGECRIKEVTPDSLAAKLKMKTGDVIISLTHGHYWKSGPTIFIHSMREFEQFERNADDISGGEYRDGISGQIFEFRMDDDMFRLERGAYVLIPEAKVRIENRAEKAIGKATSRP